MEQIRQEAGGSGNQVVGINSGQVLTEHNGIRLEFNLEGAAVEKLISIGELHVHVTFGRGES